MCRANNCKIGWIEDQPGVELRRPMITASNIQDELSDHISRISTGGIGVLQLMTQKIGQVPWPSRSLRPPDLGTGVG